MFRTALAVATRVCAVLALAAAIGLGLPGLSAAGGPTSVLLASPYADSAAAMYHSDVDYQRLSEQLGGDSLPTASIDPPPATGGAPYVTATWLIHDVMIWRIDRIFLLGADEVWIVSETSFDGAVTGEGMFPGEAGNGKAVWHQASDGSALTALLASHGLTAGVQRFGDGELVPVDTASQPPAQQGATLPAAAGVPGWVWAAGGLLAGLAIGGVVGWFVLTRRGQNPADGNPAEDAPLRMVPLA